MSTNLTNQKIKDSFEQLLHIDGGPEAAMKHVYSGTGVQTALQVGTDRVGVGKIVLLGNFITTSESGEDIILLPAGDGSLFLSNVVFTDVSEARAALLLGSLSIQNSNDVSITGGTISGVTFTGSFSGLTLVESDTLATGAAAAGVNLSGNTLGADGTDTNIDINITPKGTGSVKVPNLRVTGSFGYAPTAGGSVTQLTSKSTAVTINKLCGRITMHDAQLNRDTSVNFVVNNSLVAEDDVVVICVHSGATLGVYELDVDRVANGSFTIALRNHVPNTDYSEAVVVNFVVVKGTVT